jgi:hypothetical protein
MIKGFMPLKDINTWSDFGLQGLVIFALFAFVYFLIKEHRAERKEWIDAYREQSVLMDERQSETNGVIRELVVVVRESNIRSADNRLR